MHQLPQIVLFLGRLHPLLVHLPIGMLIALALMEVAAWFPRFKDANAGAGFILALATPFAVITVVCGWLLSLAGGYNEHLLTWHKWLGTGTAAACIVAAVFYYRRKFNAYRVSLLVTVVLLTAAGHLGGALTHGTDYLTRYAPWPLNKILGMPGEESVSPPVAAKTSLTRSAFAEVIAPIFEGKCVDCHGAAKSKSDLRLDSYAGLVDGGDDGNVFDPTNATQGELLQRVLLPVTDHSHMPPAGKPQLTTDETMLLIWWLEAGAPEHKTVAELRPPPDILKIITAHDNRVPAVK